MKRRNQRKKKNSNIKTNNLNKSDNYEIPSQFIFSPTTCESSEENKKDEKLNLIDKILSDDFIIIALIVILIIERLNLKKDGADKNVLADYDLMIAALIYIYF